MYIVSFINCSHFVHNLFIISYACVYVYVYVCAYVRICVLSFKNFPRIYTIVITRHGII